MYRENIYWSHNLNLLRSTRYSQIFLFQPEQSPPCQPVKKVACWRLCHPAFIFQTVWQSTAIVCPYFLWTVCALVLGSLLDSCTDIIMGTHKEGGATAFWSYVLNLPLSSNSIVSWKFCYLVHKILRDGHRNVSSVFCISFTLYSSSPSLRLVICNLLCLFDVQVVTDSYRYCRNVKDMGTLWVSSCHIEAAAYI